jgi:hypothetical protein
MTEYCVCGHLEQDHIWSGYTKCPPEWCWCRECLFSNDLDSTNHMHEFKLDNLKLIEDLAKKRKLV